MREIKFRVWTENVGMSRSFKFWESAEMAKAVAGHSKLATGSIPDKAPIVMQYTGFIVRGEDVYEGDILECDTVWYEVTWNDGMWWATGLFGAEDIALAEIVANSDTCLEGNVYENPELFESA